MHFRVAQVLELVCVVFTERNLTAVLALNVKEADLRFSCFSLLCFVLSDLNLFSLSRGIFCYLGCRLGR